MLVIVIKICIREIYRGIYVCVEPCNVGVNKNKYLREKRISSKAMRKKDFFIVVTDKDRKLIGCFKK